MSDRFSHHLPATPPEVSLLLRAHAEQRWLSREVAPVVYQIETGECPESGEPLPAEQLPAAYAYLEVIWCEAVQRAGDTDGALTCLELSLPAPTSRDSRVLAARARRYHATVLALRESISRRVAPLLASPGVVGYTTEACAAPAIDGYPTEACAATEPSSSSKR